MKRKDEIKKDGLILSEETCVWIYEGLVDMEKNKQLYGGLRNLYELLDKKYDPEKYEGGDEIPF